MGNNKKNEQNSSLNTKITIITVVAVVWIICLALVLARCESTKKEAGTNTHPDAVTNETETIATPYETQQSGSVKNAESKTVKYFNSHFKESYYNVIEMHSQTIDQGTMVQTVTRAYSTDGYLYEKMCDTPYSEQELGNSVIKIATPTNSYVLYPYMKTYFMSEGTTKGYTNTISFPGEQFNTGKITVEGKEYYYEEMPESNGIKTKYCFDSNDNLKFRISTSKNGSITEKYIKYSKDVDMSLFEVPADYVLQQ